MIWGDLVHCLAHCRKQWCFALLWLLGGIALAVVLATMVEEPHTGSVLGAVLAHTYRPFAYWGRCLLLLMAGLIVCYVSARTRRRILYWAFTFGAGYVLGRLAAFACMAGAVGIAGVLLCEIPFVLLAYVPVMAYYCRLKDVWLTTLRPACNRSVIVAGLRMMAVGAVLSFVYVVGVWGLVQALIHVV